MLDIALVFVSGIAIHNFVLTQFLGLCPFIGVSSNLSSSFGMALATSFVMTLASASGFVIYTYILHPFGVEYLSPLFSIVAIALIVQGVEILIKITSPLLFRSLGVFLPLITSNCAVLGVALLSFREQDSLFDASIFGFSSGLGFGIVLVLFSAFREKMEYKSNIPLSFKNTPIVFISIAIASLAFMGFIGI